MSIYPAPLSVGSWAQIDCPGHQKHGQHGKIIELITIRNTTIIDYKIKFADEKVFYFADYRVKPHVPAGPFIPGEPI